MEAYNINNHSLLIIKEETVFFLWHVRGDSRPPVIVDIFQKTGEQKLSFLDTKYSKTPPVDEDYKTIKNHYLYRMEYPKIKIEQYLTHPKESVRKVLKEIIDGSI